MIFKHLKDIFRRKKNNTKILIQTLARELPFGLKMTGKQLNLMNFLQLKS